MNRFLLTLGLTILLSVVAFKVARADCSDVYIELHASTAALQKAEATSVSTPDGLLTRLRLINNTFEPMRQASAETGVDRDCEDPEAVPYEAGLEDWRDLLLAATESRLDRYFTNAECRKEEHLWSISSVASAYLSQKILLDDWTPDASGTIVKNHVYNLTNVVAARYKMTLPADPAAANALSQSAAQALETQKATMTTSCEPEKSSAVPKAIIVIIFGSH